MKKIKLTSAPEDEPVAKYEILAPAGRALVNFSEALEALKQLKSVTRQLWDKKDNKESDYLFLLRKGDAKAIMGVHAESKFIYKYVLTDLDILAEDWYII